MSLTFEHSCFIQKTIGPTLTQCLKDLIETMPTDPIDFMAKWLCHHSDNEMYYYKKTSELLESRNLMLNVQSSKIMRQKKIAQLRSTVKVIEAESKTISLHVTQDDKMWQRRQILQRKESQLAARQEAQVLKAKEAANNELPQRLHEPKKSINEARGTEKKVASNKPPKSVHGSSRAHPPKMSKKKELTSHQASKFEKGLQKSDRISTKYDFDLGGTDLDSNMIEAQKQQLSYNEQQIKQFQKAIVEGYLPGMDDLGAIAKIVTQAKTVKQFVSGLKSSMVGQSSIDISQTTDDSSLRQTLRRSSIQPTPLKSRLYSRRELEKILSNDSNVGIDKKDGVSNYTDDVNQLPKQSNSKTFISKHRKRNSKRLFSVDAVPMSRKSSGVIAPPTSKKISIQEGTNHANVFRMLTNIKRTISNLRIELNTIAPVNQERSTLKDQPILENISEKNYQSASTYHSPSSLVDDSSRSSASDNARIRKKRNEGKQSSKQRKPFYKKRKARSKDKIKTSQISLASISSQLAQQSIDNQTNENDLPNRKPAVKRRPKTKTSKSNVIPYTEAPVETPAELNKERVEETQIKSYKLGNKKKKDSSKYPSMGARSQEADDATVSDKSHWGALNNLPLSEDINPRVTESYEHESYQQKIKQEQVHKRSVSDIGSDHKGKQMSEVSGTYTTDASSISEYLRDGSESNATSYSDDKRSLTRDRYLSDTEELIYGSDGNRNIEFELNKTSGQLQQEKESLPTNTDLSKVELGLTEPSEPHHHQSKDDNLLTSDRYEGEHMDTISNIYSEVSSLSKIESRQPESDVNLESSSKSDEHSEDEYDRKHNGPKGKKKKAQSNSTKRRDKSADKTLKHKSSKSSIEELSKSKRKYQKQMKSSVDSFSGSIQSTSQKHLSVEDLHNQIKQTKGHATKNEDNDASDLTRQISVTGPLDMQGDKSDESKHNIETETSENIETSKKMPPKKAKGPGNITKEKRTSPGQNESEMSIKRSITQHESSQRMSSTNTNEGEDKKNFRSSEEYQHGMPSDSAIIPTESDINVDHDLLVSTLPSEMEDIEPERRRQSDKGTKKKKDKRKLEKLMGERSPDKPPSPFDTESKLPDESPNSNIEDQLQYERRPSSPTKKPKELKQQKYKGTKAKRQLEKEKPEWTPAGVSVSESGPIHATESESQFQDEVRLSSITKEIQILQTSIKEMKLKHKKNKDTKVKKKLEKQVSDRRANERVRNTIVSKHAPVHQIEEPSDEIENALHDKRSRSSTLHDKRSRSRSSTSVNKIKEPRKESQHKGETVERNEGLSPEGSVVSGDHESLPDIISDSDSQHDAESIIDAESHLEDEARLTLHIEMLQKQFEELKLDREKHKHTDAKTKLEEKMSKGSVEESVQNDIVSISALEHQIKIEELKLDREKHKLTDAKTKLEEIMSKGSVEESVQNEIVSRIALEHQIEEPSAEIVNAFHENEKKESTKKSPHKGKNVRKKQEWSPAGSFENEIVSESEPSHDIASSFDTESQSHNEPRLTEEMQMYQTKFKELKTKHKRYKDAKEKRKFENQISEGSPEEYLQNDEVSKNRPEHQIELSDEIENQLQEERNSGLSKDMKEPLIESKHKGKKGQRKLEKQRKMKSSEESLERSMTPERTASMPIESTSDTNEPFISTEQRFSKALAYSTLPVFKTATWRCTQNSILICEHPLLGDMMPRPPIMPRETPDYWVAQTFRCEVLYDHEIYATSEFEIQTFPKGITGISLRDFVVPGPWVLSLGALVPYIAQDQYTMSPGSFQVARLLTSKDNTPASMDIVAVKKALWPPLKGNTYPNKQPPQKASNVKRLSHLYQGLEAFQKRKKSMRGSLLSGDNTPTKGRTSDKSNLNTSDEKNKSLVKARNASLSNNTIRHRNQNNRKYSPSTSDSGSPEFGMICEHKFNRHQHGLPYRNLIQTQENNGLDKANSSVDNQVTHNNHKKYDLIRRGERRVSKDNITTSDNRVSLSYVIKPEHHKKQERRGALKHRSLNHKISSSLRDANVSKTKFRTSHSSNTDTYGSNTDTSYGSNTETPHGSYTDTSYGSNTDTPHGSNTYTSHDSNTYTPHGSNTDISYGSNTDTSYGSNTDISLLDNVSKNKKRTPHGSNTDIEKSTLHGSNTDIKKSTLHGSNTDIKKSTLHGFKTDIQKRTFQGSKTDIKKSTLHGSKTDIQKSTFQGSNTDIKKSTLHGSNTDIKKTTFQGSNTDIKKSTLHGSNTDIKKSTLHGSKTDIQKRTFQGSKTDIQKSTLHGSNTDITKSTVHGSNTDIKKRTLNGSNTNISLPDIGGVCIAGVKAVSNKKLRRHCSVTGGYKREDPSKKISNIQKEQGVGDKYTKDTKYIKTTTKSYIGRTSRDLRIIGFKIRASHISITHRRARTDSTEIRIPETSKGHSRTLCSTEVGKPSKLYPPVVESTIDHMNGDTVPESTAVSTLIEDLNVHSTKRSRTPLATKTNVSDNKDCKHASGRRSL